MGFGQGLSGLNAAAQNLDIIGNNIANSSTVGFKAATATFADIYANSRVGLGAQVASINQRFSIGTVAATGNQFDLAIDGDKGLFRVQDPSGNTLYSRNGQFIADRDNYIVNAQGYRLTGYAPGSSSLAPIRLPMGNIPPQATSGVEMIANLDANAVVLSESGRAAQSGTVTLVDDTAVPPVSTVHYYRVDAAGTLSWYADDISTAPGVPPAQGAYTSGGNPVVIDADGQIASGEFAITGAGHAPYLPAIAATPFDPLDGNSYTHAQPLDVYDSLGNAHQLTQYFVKRAGEPGTASQWDVYYRLDGRPVNASTDGGAPTTGPIEMRFDPAGRLISGQTVALAMNDPGGIDSPAAALAITVDYGDTTQFGGNFSASFAQDGHSTGEYAGMSIAADGSMLAHYTNGENRLAGHLALAHFNNLQGLQPVGGNAWMETSESGPPFIGLPGTNGLATIKGQAVEESNVDMSQELVNMIIAQRTYQANAQTIKTQDQILQTLITMR